MPLETLIGLTLPNNKQLTLKALVMSNMHTNTMIEKILEEDVTGKAKSSLIECYGTYQAELDQKIAQGLSPNEFEHLNVVRSALKATNNILMTL